MIFPVRLFRDRLILISAGPLCTCAVLSCVSYSTRRRYIGRNAFSLLSLNRVHQTRHTIPPGMTRARKGRSVGYNQSGKVKGWGRLQCMNVRHTLRYYAPQPSKKTIIAGFFVSAFPPLRLRLHHSRPRSFLTPSSWEWIPLPPRPLPYSLPVLYLYLLLWHPPSLWR